MVSQNRINVQDTEKTNISMENQGFHYFAPNLLFQNPNVSWKRRNAAFMMANLHIIDFYKKIPILKFPPFLMMVDL